MVFGFLIIPMQVSQFEALAIVWSASIFSHSSDGAKPRRSVFSAIARGSMKFKR